MEQEAKRYWVVVDGVFSVRDDGTVEYAEGYTPEKARAAFEQTFPRLSGDWSGLAAYDNAKHPEPPFRDGWNNG